MSTSVIEPGTRLAGRYRLEDRVSEAGGSSFWKATDEILARPVAVLTFAPGFPRAHDVVTAARAASRLTDPRLTQVFDADDSGELAYVVSEWVSGETLEDLLAQGPLDSDRAASFLVEAAEAITSAHAAGLAHLCLTPHNLVWTSGGTIKITGLAVEAVLSGAVSDDPARDDAQGLGRLLYAALTGHSAGAESSTLPPAPTHDGHPLPPAQVRAGVPRDLDSIVVRALRLTGQEPLTSPGAIAEALGEVPRSPLPFVPLVGSTPPGVIPRPPAREQPAHNTSAVSTTPQPQPHVPTQQYPPAAPPSVPPRRPSPTRHGADRQPVNRPLIAVVAVIALVVVVIGGWGLSQLGGNKKKPQPAKSSAPLSKTPSVKPLKPVGARAYNPPPHADETAPRDTGKAIDASNATYWSTQHYNDPRFGNYRKGIGLVLDMGRSVSVDRVQVTMPGGTPGAVDLRVGDTGMPGMRKVDDGPAVGTFRLDGKQAKGRYVMLWFTKLPQIGSYKIKVNDVAVYGAP